MDKYEYFSEHYAELAEAQKSANALHLFKSWGFAISLVAAIFVDGPLQKWIALCAVSFGYVLLESMFDMTRRAVAMDTAAMLRYLVSKE